MVNALANRPVDLGANDAGFLFLASDTKDSYEWTGAAWTRYGGTPAGAITQFAGASIPGGWLLCYGQAVSRSTYADLFAAVGTTYGAGDGSTTFNLPDLRGNVPVGLDNMGGSAAHRVTAASSLGASGGEAAHLLTIVEMPSHTHPPDPGMAGFWEWPNAGPTDIQAGGNYNAVGKVTQTGPTGGGLTHNNLQPWVGLNYIIRT